MYVILVNGEPMNQVVSAEVAHRVLEHERQSPLRWSPRKNCPQGFGMRLPVVTLSLTAESPRRA